MLGCGHNKGVRPIYDTRQERAIKHEQALLAHDIAVPGDDKLHIARQETTCQMRRRVREMEMNNIVVVLL